MSRLALFNSYWDSVLWRQTGLIINIPLSRTSAALNLCWMSSWIAPFFPWYWSGYSLEQDNFILIQLRVGNFSITLATEYPCSIMHAVYSYLGTHSYSFMCLRSFIWAIAPISLFLHRTEFYSFNLGCITIAAMQAQSCSVSIATRYYRNCLRLDTIIILGSYIH